ncbi:hypothetical protein M5D96_010627, partial [Drosophila gunungcola]
MIDGSTSSSGFSWWFQLHIKTFVFFLYLIVHLFLMSVVDCSEEFYSAEIEIISNKVTA